MLFTPDYEFSSQLIEAALQEVDESAENYFVVYLNGKQNVTIKFSKDYV